uniref:Zinc finger and BTB domain containing 5 n=1 Tax=Amphiprion percula TaxID=161767 RepID=A0A3P8TEW7_AMPPE
PQSPRCPQGLFHCMSHIFKQLNHQRLHAQLCDCVVVVGGQTFQAHRSILAACSSHFRALLSSTEEVGDPGADRGPNVMELDPEVVTPEAFSTLLDMIYTSTLSLRASNVMDVLLAASHLHLNAVVKACKLHLSRRNFPSSPPKGWRSREAADLGEDSVDGEGLDSLSDLAFSCFLNPSSESMMGALEEEDSLASLTAAATAAAAAASDAPAAPEPTGEQKSEEANASSANSSDSSSSLVFPVTSVPLQQLFPTQSPGFSDTIILQPTQNSLAGFLSGIRPGLSLEASLIQPSRAGKNAGTTTFHSSSGSVGDATNQTPLTRASEDVLSKCKKAAAQDHVLLVEGEKKYACKICCKTFMNLTDCKKHIRVHTGEKPYPCPKCGKRFSQSSHLYKHSKNTLHYYYILLD